MRSLLFYSLFCFTVLLSAGPLSAQPKDNIRQFKKAFLTETLSLTAEQREPFFQVYDQYEGERVRLRREINRVKRGMMARTDDQLKSDIGQIIRLKEEEVALDRQYMDKFLKIISIRQLAALYQAEQQIKVKLLERFREMNGQPED